MNTCGDDILNLDLDPDVLIHLLGKLSLDNIPNDVSETLSSIENRTDEFVCNEIQACALIPNEESFQNNLFVINEQNNCVQQNVTISSQPDEKRKNSFLSSIGLVSDSCDPFLKTKNKKTVSTQDNVCKGHDNSLFKLESNKNQNESSLLQAECSTTAEPDNFKKKCSTSTSTNRYGQNTSFCSEPTSNSFNFFNMFNRGGQVFDIKLNDIDSIKSDIQKLPFHSLEETSNDSNDKYFHSDLVLNQECDSNDSSCNSLLSTKQCFDSSNKSSNSQDSGYDTSSSTVSPSPPLVNTQTFNSLEFLDDIYDEELENIVATIVEVENSITVIETARSYINVPVLKDAKNPEDHKEKILNFLKEPISSDSIPIANNTVSVANVVSSDISSGLLETKQLNFLNVEYVKRDTSPVSLHVKKKSSPHSRKSPLKAKDKLGYELKYASKKDLGHLVIFSKGNHSDMNKILKQIQDDEQTKKKIKVIHLIDKKLKRTAADDRENQKRRRLLSSKEENQYKDSYVKC
ncbi:uncharacterized protein NPIL_399911 [Nephila pilipes]|uniref:Uncharacterized protein n=1 Tax=Nephila pilipes TaxID=299642 RepID=A0A8X6PQA9_NEPPI|nr:uncharacterized protein NPIL_399911 [Nephila pilipes]